VRFTIPACRYYHHYLIEVERYVFIYGSDVARRTAGAQIGMQKHSQQLRPMIATMGSESAYRFTHRQAHATAIQLYYSVE
jgi:hypothetical protein